METQLDPTLARGISVVIPVFRYSDSLPRLVDDLLACQSTYALEVVIVDDSGERATWEKISGVQARRRDDVSCIRLGKNVGQHAALFAGTRFCRFEYTVTMDDDLQHDPNEIPNLVAALKSGFDLVYGRLYRTRHARWRRLASWALRRIQMLLLGNSLAQHSSSLRIFRTRLRDAFLTLGGPQVHFDAALSWATSNVGMIPVAHRARPEGRSSYSLRRLIRTARDSVTTFSTRPLRLIISLGLVVALLGLALFAWSLYLGIRQSQGVPGFAFLASALSLFSGVQLVSLGILGEYLGQVHLRSMNVPAFFITESNLSRQDLPETR